jgi:hypothetical protein
MKQDIGPFQLCRCYLDEKHNLLVEENNPVLAVDGEKLGAT